MRIFSAVLMALLVMTGGAFAEIWPGAANKHLNDYGDLLTPSDEAQILGRLVALERDHDIEFSVLTIDRMAEYGYSGSIEGFAQGVFDHWGIGDRERNDGILFLVSVEDREARIEMGLGYANRHDAALVAIMDNDILSQFRRGDYAAGIRDGVVGVIAVVDGSVGTGDADWGDWFPILFVTLIVFFTVLPLMKSFLPLAFGPLLQRAPVCPTHASRMDKIPPERWMSHITEAQKFEEKFRSAWHKGYGCRMCNAIEVVSVPRLTSTYEKCRSCGTYAVHKYRTGTSAGVKGKSGTMRPVQHLCKFCHET